MDFSRGGPSLFALSLGVRAIVVGALTFLAAALLVRTQLYATVLVLLGAIALVVAGMADSIARADRMLARLAESLSVDGLERPVLPTQGFFRSSQAIERALERMASSRAQRERRLDYAEGLLDTVGAALLVVGPDGGVELANRAARRLVGETVARLGEIRALEPEAVAQIAALAPGARVMVRLVGGAPMLALATDFRVPGGGRRRLVSLQPVTGELDAVEQKAWRDLAHILAHEMMNSLTPIVSLSQSVPALLASGGAADAAEAAEVIARRATRLMEFVDGYRRFADLPPPEMTPFALADLLADIDRLMGETLRTRGIGYASAVTPPDLSLTADRGLLEQAVINLVKNAAEAAGANPAPQVRVDCRRADGRVLIAVADNGRGVAPEDRERIFIPFFTTRPQGTGVGLSLARQIAVAHSGYLEVLPPGAAGSVFQLVLPMTTDGVQAEQGGRQGP